MRCYRKIAGKTKRDRVRSERMREQVGQESVRRVLEERQAKWFGRVYRMERERKPKQLWRLRLREENKGEDKE
jgi:hypothetical protein